MDTKTIYTIGHSTRTPEEFLDLLKTNHITCLVDVRSYPGSRRYPHFNQKPFKDFMEDAGIKYYHLKKLGGRRPKIPNHETKIRSVSFSSYAAYMKTNSFKEGLDELKVIANDCGKDGGLTAIMCAEAVWWNCHRRMIADILVLQGYQVYHLGLKKEPICHEVWDIAKIVDENITYE